MSFIPAEKGGWDAGLVLFFSPTRPWGSVTETHCHLSWRGALIQGPDSFRERGNEALGEGFSGVASLILPLSRSGLDL
jgi:hypothetical protein